MSGFALIHRSLLGHPAFRNDAEAMTFAWMVLRASWKPVRVRYKGKAISLQRGQLAVSVRDLAETMDRDKAWVERLFKRLKAETMIETHNETGVSVVTICNYAQYQSQSDDDETLGETSRETDARQTRDTEQQNKQNKQETRLEAKASSCAVGLDEIVSSWNQMAKANRLPAVAKLTDKRRRALAARLKDDGLDAIQRAIQRIPTSPFLLGQAGSWSGSHFDFLLKPDTVTKINEGRYDGKHQPSISELRRADPLRAALADAIAEEAADRERAGRSPPDHPRSVIAVPAH